METNLTVPAPGDSSLLVVDQNALLEKASALVITSEEQCKEANTWMRDAATLDKKAVEHMAKSKKMAKDLHTQLCEDEKALREIPQRIRYVLEPKILAFRRAEAAKAAKVAEAKRQEELKRLEDEREAKALALEAAGMPEVAAAVIDAPMPPSKPLASYAPPPVKLEGSAVRRSVKFRILEPDEVPRELCSPDDKKIRAQIGLTGLKPIAGVEIYEEESLATRAWK